MNVQVNHSTLFRRVIETALETVGTPLDSSALRHLTWDGDLHDLTLVPAGLDRALQSDLFSRYENVFDHMATRSGPFRARYADEPGGRASTRMFLSELQKLPSQTVGGFCQAWRERQASSSARAPFVALALGLEWLSTQTVRTFHDESTATFTLRALAPVERFLSAGEILRLRTLESRWGRAQRGLSSPRLAKVAFRVVLTRQEDAILRESDGIADLLGLAIER